MMKGVYKYNDPGRMLMFIFQHPKGSGVELEVRVYGNVMNFSTRVTGGSGTYRIGAGYKVECEPVMMDDKVISFGKHDITALIHNSDDGRVYKYSASATSYGKNVFRIYCAADAKPENFRGAFRVPCNYRSTLRIGDSRATIEGITHDLSFSGAAYIFTSGKSDAHEQDMIKADIYDENGTKYQTKGHVVRIVEDFNPGFTLIGVQFDDGVDMHELVSRTQLEELKKLRH